MLGTAMLTMVVSRTARNAPRQSTTSAAQVRAPTRLAPASPWHLDGSGAAHHRFWRCCHYSHVFPSYATREHRARSASCRPAHGLRIGESPTRPPYFYADHSGSWRTLTLVEKGNEMSRKQLKESVPLADASAGLRASMRPPELRDRRRLLLEALEHEADPEAHLQLAFLDYMTHDFDGARVHGETAYRDFRRRGSRRRAAVAANAVGRIHFEGYNNLPAARGWFARGRTMLAGEGDCVERGWVELGLVGCSVPDVSVLAVKAAAAVELARRFDDVDLECKALADQGLALVSMGRINEGMELIDEAMAIVSTGDVLPFAAGQVSCCTLSACERAGDLPRADAWLRALELAGVARPDDQSPILFAHCQGAYGSLLCRLGRWSEAETALSMSLTVGRGGFYSHLVLARGALADLRTRQGRFEEADKLLAECGDRWEAMPPAPGSTSPAVSSTTPPPSSSKRCARSVRIGSASSPFSISLFASNWAAPISRRRAQPPIAAARWPRRSELTN